MRLWRVGWKIDMKVEVVHVGGSRELTQIAPVTALLMPL